MNRLITLRLFRPVRDIIPTNRCIRTGRELSTTSLCQKRLRRRNNSKEKDQNKEDNEDHIEAFERQRKLQTELRKDRQSAREKKDNREKTEENDNKEAANKFGKGLVFVFMASLMHSLYTGVTLGFSKAEQEGMSNSVRLHYNTS